MRIPANVLRSIRLNTTYEESDSDSEIEESLKPLQRIVDWERLEELKQLQISPEELKDFVNQGTSKKNFFVDHCGYGKLEFIMYLHETCDFETEILYKALEQSVLHARFVCSDISRYLVHEILKKEGQKIKRNPEYLLYACNQEDLEMVMFWLYNGWDVNGETTCFKIGASENITALHEACTIPGMIEEYDLKQRLKVIELLMERGADLDAKTSLLKRTPLHLAASSNWYGKDVVEKLLAKLESFDSKNTQKATADNPATKALQRAYMISPKDANGDTPFMMACSHGSCETVEFFVRQYIKIVSKVAIDEESFKELQLLFVGSLNRTPLHYAVFSKYGNVPEWLVRKWEQKINLIFELLDACDDENPLFDVNALTSEGYGVLHDAIIQENPQATLALLGLSPVSNELKVPKKKRCDPNIKNPIHKNVSPILYACREGWHKQVETLLRAGIDPNICDDNGTTPLHSAATNQKNDPMSFQTHTIITKMLLAHPKIKKNLQNIEGNTPVHMAVIFRQKNVFDLLQESMFDINAVNKNGITPLGYAKHLNFAQIAKYVMEKGGI